MWWSGASPQAPRAQADELPPLELSPDDTGDEEDPVERDPIDLDPIDVTDTPLPDEDRREPTAVVRRVDATARAGLGEELGDLLGRLPGVVLRRFGSALQPASVQVRGASPEQVLVLLDGVRLNGLASGRFDLSMLPLAAVETVTVMASGGAASHGSGAEGGVVSMSLLGPRGRDGLHTTLAAGGGTPGTARVDGNLAWRGGPLAVGGGVAWLHDEGDFDFVDDQGTEHTRTNNDGDRVATFAVAELGRRRDRSARLSVLGAWLERGAPGPAEFPGQFRRARTEDAQLVAALAGQYAALVDTPDFELDLEGQLGWRLATSVYDNPTALLGGAALHTERIEQAIEPRLEAVAWAGDGLSATRLVTELRHERLDRALDRAADPTHHDRTTVAAALLQDLTPHDSITVQAAVRVDADPDRAEAVVLPRAGVVVRPFEAAELRLNVSRAFRRPTFEELYAFTEFLRGDPGLEPERAVVADLALRVRPLDELAVEVSVFTSDYEKLILFVPATALYVQARNLTGATIQGLELAADATPLPWLELAASYAWTRARFQAPPHDPLPGRPEHTARASVATTLGPVRAELEARYLGERYLDAFGNTPEPGAVWLDAAVSWDIDPSWRLAAKANNLLDVDDAVDALQQPRPGLTVFGSVTWRASFLETHE